MGCALLCKSLLSVKNMLTSLVWALLGSQFASFGAEDFFKSGDRYGMPTINQLIRLGREKKKDKSASPALEKLSPEAWRLYQGVHDDP